MRRILSCLIGVSVFSLGAVTSPAHEQEKEKTTHYVKVEMAGLLRQEWMLSQPHPSGAVRIWVVYVNKTRYRLNLENKKELLELANKLKDMTVVVTGLLEFHRDPWAIGVDNPVVRVATLRPFKPLEK